MKRRAKEPNVPALKQLPIPTHEAHERIHLPRVDSCCEWGTPRILLCRQGAKSLFWRPGYTDWSSVGQTRYYPGGLYLQDRASRDPNSILRMGRGIHRGGRLSRKLFAAHAQEIDAFFGYVVTPLLDPKYTIVIVSRRRS